MVRRMVSKVAVIVVLLAGPFGCLPKATDRATNTAIGGLMAYDLDQCIQKSNNWAAYDACEAALRACAQTAKTVAEYDVCSDKVTR